MRRSFMMLMLIQQQGLTETLYIRSAHIVHILMGQLILLPVSLMTYCLLASLTARVRGTMRPMPTMTVSQLPQTIKLVPDLLGVIISN